MPGIAGCISLSDRNINPDISDLFRSKLVHEDYYEFRDICSSAGSAVYLIDPNVNNLLCGVSCCNTSRIKVGFYGEFYDREFQNLATGNDIANNLLILYKQYGENIAQKLDGSFILFIADNRTDSYLLINDHYASRPLFYTVVQNKLFFSPEFKPLIFIPGITKEISKEAIITFLVNGNLLNDQTFNNDIKPLMPGSILKVRNGKLIFNKYYQYTLEGDSEDKGEEFYIESLSTLLMKAIRKRLRNIKKTVIPISGGYDSRGILGCVSKMVEDKIRTVSWGTDEDKTGSDAAVGRQVANLLNTDHFFLKRSSNSFVKDFEEMFYLTDGLTDDSCFHHNELSIMRKIRYELNGEYLIRGDECFGYGGEASNDIEGLARIGICTLANYGTLEKLLNPSRLGEFRKISDKVINELIDDCKIREFNDRKDYFYFTQRLFHYLNRSSYYKMIVLELQNPWLDKEILDFYKTVPTRYRIDKYLYKKTLQKMFPDLYNIPFATSDSLENWMDIIKRSKEIQKFINYQLLEKDNGFKEFLNVDQLKDFLTACFTGNSKSSVRIQLIRNIKQVLQRFPGLYRFLKVRTMQYIRVGEISEETIIFRLLIASRCFDLFG
jgi:asparagine synthetase B (glutamine-hydrolysing)